MTQAIELTIDDARAWTLAAQGIGSEARSALDAVERRGWVRTLGGVDVYLAIHARCAGASRADVDLAVDQRQLRVSPAARGCIYLVAERHAGAALRLARRLVAKREAREHAKVGIEDSELNDLGDAVLGALGDGPLTTTALRRALPDGSIRSLGEIGKKVGISSTLPPTLRRLEFAGRIERLQDTGRLDTERYQWRLTEGDPLADLPAADAEIDALVAELFLRAAGFGSVDSFAAWSGLGKRDARAALDRLDTVPVRLEGEDRPWLALADAVPSAEALDAARRAIAFLPFADNAVALHDGPARLVDADHHAIEIPAWGRSRPVAIGEARHSSVRMILAEGRMVGFWEFDPTSETIVTGCFDTVGDDAAARIRDRADALGAFIRDELGHGRSFSIDTDAGLTRRTETIRALVS